MKRKSTCSDCECTYYKPKGWRYSICPACVADIIEAGGEPGEAQPKDRTEYRPRFNGMKAFGD